LARTFGKRHKIVLRAYDNLQCSPEFGRLNFEPVENVEHKGESRRMVKMTKDGFMVQVMGLAGCLLCPGGLLDATNALSARSTMVAT
jgi:Rha family phage regulatory protein